MEQFKTIFLTFIFVLVCFFVCGIFLIVPKNTQSANVAEDFLRIHIRANSNSDVDQNIKYQVKDEIVKALVPILSETKSKNQAMELIESNLSLVESVANKVLLGAGFSYKSQAQIKREFFPTRTYDGLTLQSDYYDAIILNLGSGKGDNWWCVAYPPLCFVGSEDGTQSVVYRSKLVEIIKKFFN